MFVPLHISSILVWYVPIIVPFSAGNCRGWPAGLYTGLLCAAVCCCCVVAVLLCAAVVCCCCVLLANSYPAGWSHHLRRCRSAAVRSETAHETVTFVLQELCHSCIVASCQSHCLMCSLMPDWYIWRNRIVLTCCVSSAIPA